MSSGARCRSRTGGSAQMEKPSAQLCEFVSMGEAHTDQLDYAALINSRGSLYSPHTSDIAHLPSRGAFGKGRVAQHAACFPREEPLGATFLPIRANTGGAALSSVWPARRPRNQRARLKGAGASDIGASAADAAAHACATSSQSPGEQKRIHLLETLP